MDVPAGARKSYGLAEYYKLEILSRAWRTTARLLEAHLLFRIPSKAEIMMQDAVDTQKYLVEKTHATAGTVAPAQEEATQRLQAVEDPDHICSIGLHGQVQGGGTAFIQQLGRVCSPHQQVFHHLRTISSEFSFSPQPSL
jgi:hypothetical protein